MNEAEIVEYLRCIKSPVAAEAVALIDRLRARVGKAELEVDRLSMAEARTTPVPAAIVQVAGAVAARDWHAFADLDEAFRFVRAADRDGTLIRIGGWIWHPAPARGGRDA